MNRKPSPSRLASPLVYGALNGCLDASGDVARFDTEGEALAAITSESQK